MKFLIVTHVVHTKSNNRYFAYEPYVREMNIWLKYVDEVVLLAPLANHEPTAIEDFYKHSKIDFRTVPAFSLTNFKNGIISVFKIPGILFKMSKAMQQVDHIHLRCPGNMGLLACFVQIFFPSKTKTAKYAGNWDPKAKQPWTYRLQKWILSNIFLTRNIKVLVYGQWDNQSANIQSFFTASYSEREEKTTVKTIGSNEKIRMLFVGSLVEGKNPLYAIRLLEQLKLRNLNVQLDVFGDGPLRLTLQNYIEKNNLSECVFLHGNQNQEVLKKAYQESHFVILASKSEGWPKAVAEAMFWAAVPVATAVSCVPYMLDYGNRGVLLAMDLEKDATAISELIRNPLDFKNKSTAAMNWSGAYTLERFETEIQKMLQV